MPSRHQAGFDHKVGGGVAPDNERDRVHGVLATIDKANQMCLRNRGGWRNGRGRAENTGGAGTAGIADSDLISPDSQLVSVHQRGRIHPQPCSVHENLRTRLRRGDHRHPRRQ